MHPEARPTKPPYAVLFETVTGKWVSAAISAAAKLGVADQADVCILKHVIHDWDEERPKKTPIAAKPCGLSLIHI